MQNAASDQGLQCLLTICSTKFYSKMKNTTIYPYNGNVMVHLKSMGNSIRLKWVNTIQRNCITFHRVVNHLDDQEGGSKELLAIRRIFSLVDMITNTKGRLHDKSLKITLSLNSRLTAVDCIK